MLIFIGMPTMPDIDINQNFEIAFRFATETNENIFLTGKAGTGKTTFLKYLKDHCNKNMVIAAPTGVAAINAGGVTLHSLFQLPFHPFLPNEASAEELLSRLKYNRRRLDTLRKMDLLVIDEVSMVRCDVIDAIDSILKSVRGNFDESFGGLQVLFIGDLYQLPPVALRDEWEVLKEYYDSPFFFDSHSLRNEMPVFIELKKIYRQSESGFIDLLNKIRHNQMDDETCQMLNSRYQPGFNQSASGKFITLTSHNNQAGTINQRELSKLVSEPFVFDAEIEGDFPENSYPAEVKLTLKRGAQVMFLKNDTFGKYFNGKIGIVDSLSADEITVACDNELIEVSPETWEHLVYETDKSEGKLIQHKLGSFTQYPLRLAWATTIHKSQGLTFDKVVIDAARAFAGGQVYVALSRCTQWEGIVLLSKIPPTAIRSNQNVVDLHNRYSNNSLPERFAGARTAFILNLFDQLFSFEKPIRMFEKIIPLIGSVPVQEDVIKWRDQFYQKLSEAHITGGRFLSELNNLINDQPVVENNEKLQKRLADASSYFLKPTELFLNMLEMSHIEIEHVELAKKLNVSLTDLYLYFHSLHHSLQFLKKPFVLTGFLKYKFDYNPPRTKINVYAGSRVSNSSGYNELLVKLKQWRNNICDRYNLPVYMVANQESLIQITQQLPTNEKSLMEIKGFGNAKVKKYGKEILEIVKEYCEEEKQK